MWVTLSLRKKELKQEHTYYQLQDLQISRQKRQLARRKSYESSLIQLHQKQATKPIKTSYDEQVAELKKNKEALSLYLQAVKHVKNNSIDNYVVDGADKNKVYIKSDGGNYICEQDSSNHFYNINDLEKDENGNYSSGGIGISANKNSSGAIQRYQLAYDLSKYTAILSKYGFNTDLTQINDSTDVSALESSINSEKSTIELKISEAQTQYTNELNNEKEYWENELSMLEEEVGDEETELELEQTDIETQMEFISNELQAVNDAVSQGIQGSTIKLS